jgi:cysteinyl-tRNA synthetase
VRYFIHSAFLVGKSGSKISKSAGKFPLLSDVTGMGLDPLAFRVFCLGAKYRSELMLTDEGLRAAQSNLDYLREFARDLRAEAAAADSDSAFAAEYRDRFLEGLNNDLNTPQALAVALELVAEAYRRNDRKIWKTLAMFDRVLGLDLEQTRLAGQSESYPPEVRALIDERAAARQAKDFKRADELRATLEARGYEVKDGKGGAATYRLRSPRR